jgi:DNA-binding XRE family transcriptional regulator
MALMAQHFVELVNNKMLLAGAGPGRDDWRMVPRLSPARVRKQFAERLRQARSIKFGTMAEFARELGVEEETYRRWERAETEPNLANLIRILALTNVSAEFLVAGRIPPPETRAKLAKESRVRQVRFITSKGI